MAKAVGDERNRDCTGDVLCEHDCESCYLYLDEQARKRVAAGQQS